MTSTPHLLAALALISLAPCHLPAAEAVPANPPRTGADPKSLEHFADLRFGAMFHWGPAVLRNNEISWSMSNRAKYEAVYSQFNPKRFDPEAWAGVAAAAGSRYVVYVCKHHDGFCMWDTQTTDNNIMNTPFKRDVTGELAAACKKQQLFFGAYLSIMDIHEAKWDRCYPARTDMPGYPEGLPHIREVTEKQTLELMKKYDAQILWYDGAWLEGWRKSEHPLAVAQAIRACNPRALITRLDNPVDDYECMEARIGTWRPVPWEMVTSVAYPTYSYNTRIQYRTPEYFVQTLSRVVCGNGNLLLNFVPDADGAIPEAQLQIAREIGAWLKVNGEAVYGTRGGPWYPGNWGGSTRKGKTLYVHLLPAAPETLRLPPCGAKVLGSRLLNGQAATVKQTDAGLELSVPQASRDAKVTVVALEMDAEVAEMVEASKSLKLPDPKPSAAIPPPREELPK